MKFLSLVGNSFGCSASGERLVSAARDGDLQEAKALLEYNPRLARYSTFGIRNSPLHYSAAQGHHEIVTLLLESGVDINLRNYRGQTALMQACQYGHWEVVQALIIFKANVRLKLLLRLCHISWCILKKHSFDNVITNSSDFECKIHKADYLNGGTALHLAALNGRSRCIRLLLADYIPSIPDLCSILQQSLNNHENIPEFDKCALHQVINRPADGGITALHMAALNGHTETVQLLLDMGASVTVMTVEDGSTIDLIGAGSTSLHYAACGGNAQCCHILVDKGASLTAENANGWTPLMVARSWHRDWLEDIFTAPEGERPPLLPSPYLCLPLMSVIKIARDCGWRGSDCLSTCMDPCVVCLERECTVEAKGCSHEFCTHCALYLCSTSSTSIVGKGPPGSIACPLCRHGIVSFSKLESMKANTKEVARTSLSLPFCTCSAEGQELTSLETPFCKPEFRCNRISPCGSAFRSLSCSRFPLKLNGSLCMGAPDTSPSLVVSRTADRNLRNLAKCSRSTYRRSNSQTEAGRSWLCSFSHSVVTSSGC